MKLFKIHRTCQATIDIEVSAENEQDAIRIAHQRFNAIPAKEYTFTEDEVSVTGSQDIEDIEKLKEEFFMKFEASKDYGVLDEISFFNNVYVHMICCKLDEVWNTYEEVEQLFAVSGVSTDGEDIYLGFDGEGPDADITELDDAEQIAVLKAAINAL